MERDNVNNHKTDYVAQLFNILNTEEFLNQTIGSKVKIALTDQANRL